MCLLIVKPKGAEMPDIYTLYRAHLCNPHGCGFASTNDYYRSLDFEQFIERLEKVGKDEACIIHFRFATHGSVKVANCHPFKGEDIYFAHNGILSIKPFKDKTDSETAFRKYLLPAILKYGFHSSQLANEVENIIGCSKFAFLRDNDVRMFGQFYKVKDCYFSNLRVTSSGVW